MKEIWKQVPNTKNEYWVSNFGKFKVVKHGVSWERKGSIRTTRGNMNYISVSIDSYPYRIHRLVATLFVPNPLNLPQVAHGDHDRSNNNLWNLKWSTQKDNTNEGIEAGRINANRPKKNRKVTPSLICEIALLHSQGKGVNEIAIMIDFPRTTISSVFNGRSNKELFEFAREEIKNNP